MEKDYLFSKSDVVDDKVNIRSNIYGKTIAGIFLKNNIRFYYNPIYDKVKNSDLRRLLRANSEDFSIDNNSVKMKVKDCDLIKTYNFKDGVFVLYSMGYFDIIPYNDLDGYLKDFEFTNVNEEKIKSNKLLLLKREVNNSEDLNFTFKRLDD